MCRAVRVERTDALLGISFIWQLWIYIGVENGFESESDLLYNYAEALTKIAVRRTTT